MKPLCSSEEGSSLVQGHFVYMVQYRDGSLSTGYTQDVMQRVATHNAGTGAKYTRGRGPVVLLASWSCESKQDALRAEYAIKRLSRAQKWRLIGMCSCIGALAVPSSPQVAIQSSVTATPTALDSTSKVTPTRTASEQPSLARERR